MVIKLTKSIVETCTYTLEMDQEFAQLLFDIAGRIGGDPRSRRRLVENVREELYEAGLRPTRTGGASDIASGMIFEDAEDA